MNEVDRVDGMTVRFWGVRGSLPCPGQDWLRYGGNTPCIEVRCDDTLLILDAGTGIHALGAAMEGPTEAHILLTHTHQDHIQGLPFFGPIFDPRNTFELWAGHLNGRKLHQVLSDFMAEPLFPVPPAIFGAHVTYRDFECGQTLTLAEDLVAQTAPLNHPNGATGYRIEHRGRILAYITDTEHVPGELDENVLALARDADLMVYDSTYTDEEYPAHEGWGHSTWQQGVRLADAARAKRLVIFHHDPHHDDAFMDQVASEARAARNGTLVAREGQVLSLPPVEVD